MRRSGASRDRLEKEHPHQFVDLYYEDLLTDPMGCLKTVYQSSNRSLDEETEIEMRQWLLENPQNKFGKHDYPFADYGFTEREIESRFEEYSARYDIALDIAA